MTNSKFIKTLGIAAAVGLSACASNTQADSKTNSIDPRAVDAVLVALDDEYMAQSLYKAILDKHGDVRPFSNIINAEKHHADMLIGLLNIYGQPVPANPYENGQKAKFVAPATLLEACQTGVTAEIANIDLYNKRLLPAVTNHPEITDVMLRLRDASEQRHLRAFQRCVSNGGVMGQGGGRGRGRGNGRGMSQGY